MPDLAQERLDLDAADRHLAEGERRITDLILLIEDETAKGRDTTEARKLLRNFEQTMETWRVHRGLIADAIARAQPPDPEVR
ncbi:hypothetical protein [Microvirga massiliensis]|uniref:hypothetical protein n=1 Tax=Microvirga massiliensis TaxID=1033741 RepID=UPI00062B606D|nr:hypothetical protein [Microvirga massiliensis]